jgi:hypothetical protein
MATTKTDDFTKGALYKKLVEVLPAYAQDPFSKTPTLNVQRLREAVDKSHEAVYKWLRSSRLTPPNVDAIVELANSTVNLAALKQLGRKPPTREDFLQFVFTA